MNRKHLVASLKRRLAHEQKKLSVLAKKRLFELSIAAYFDRYYGKVVNQETRRKAESAWEKQVFKVYDIRAALLVA